MKFPPLCCFSKRLVPLRSKLVWSGIGVFALAGWACSDSGVARCHALLDSSRFQDVTEHCVPLYESSGDPRIGMMVATAEKELGNLDAALGWGERLRSTEQESEILELAGAIYHEQARNEEAAHTYRRLAELYEIQGRDVRLAETYHRLGYLAWERSGYGDALAYAQKAVRLATTSEDLGMKVKTLQGLWTYLYVTGDLDSSVAALEFLEDLIPADQDREQAYLLASKGAVLIDQGRLHLAKDACRRALARSEAISDARYFRSVHLNLAHIHTELGELSEADHHLQEAWKFKEDEASRQTALFYYQARLDLARGRYESAGESIAVALAADPVPEWAWWLEYERGRLAEVLDEPRLAEVAYLSSIGIVERMRASLGIDELKNWLLDQKRKPYEALFRLRAEAGRIQEAVDVMERAKARTFLDAFVKSTSGGTAPREDLLSEGLTDRVELLRELLPRMQSSPIVSTSPLESVLSAIGGRTVLAYFVAEDDVWLVTLIDGDLGARKLASSARAIAERVSAFENGVDDLELASSLADLFLPAGALPDEPGVVHVVTDGASGRVPFAALRVGGRYLAETHALTFVPSLNALAVLSRGREPAIEGRAIVLADPAGDLASAALEARQVAAVLGAQTRLGANATRLELERAADADVLHLATHSGVGLRGAWIQLADGRVGALEISELGVGPRLVVLASCASAARNTKGMWGSLGAAFLAAGSRRAVATLGTVDDELTRRFVVGFYEHGGASRSAAAVARAQHELIREGRPPSSWAPFVHLGIGDDFKVVDQEIEEDES